MTDQTKDTGTNAADTGNADAGAKSAGAVAAAPAAEAKPSKASKALQEAMDKIAPSPTVVVTGPEKGRWRAGRKFTREPSSIPLRELTEGDLEKLQADPELMVQIIDAPH